MLTAAALGMFVYGVYSVGWAVVDLAGGARLELWAELGLMLFGALLVLAAAFVRVRLPGGLAFAMGAMLGLQALAVHGAAHLKPASRRRLCAARSPWCSSRWRCRRTSIAKRASRSSRP